MASANNGTYEPTSNIDDNISNGDGSIDTSIDAASGTESVIDGQNNSTGTATSGTASADPYAATDAPIARKRKRTATSTGTESGKRTAKKTPPVDLTKQSRKTIANYVTAIHSLLDAGFGLKNFFAITPLQGEELTNAYMDVLEQFDITVSPKTAALMNCGVVTMAVYSPKVTALMKYKQMQRQQAAQAVPNPNLNNPDNVTKMVFN